MASILVLEKLSETIIVTTFKVTSKPRESVCEQDHVAHFILESVFLSLRVILYESYDVSLLKEVKE